MYKLVFMTQAQRDAKKLSAGGLKEKALQLLKLVEEDPYCYPPEYEYLKGDMKGLISRRINQQHRLVYEVLEAEKIVKIHRMWTYYE